MPPWLPAPVVAFENERRLSDVEISLIEKWIASGAAEGNASDLPPKPEFEQGWTLGKPDLILEMPEPYMLSPEGKDSYRNFVLPIPISEKRYVAAYEFRPGGAKAIHHAFLTIDRSGDARRKDAEDSAPGFPGLHASVRFEPSHGFFMSWQPGRVPSRYRDGMAWPLLPGSDLVLQVHLQHTGKPEAIQPSVGLYFTSDPSPKNPIKIGIRSMDIDIPAGASNYQTTASFKLPADVDVIGVLPHAHYRAKKMEGFALLPNGWKQWLLLIDNWDFNWQGDYSYKNPLFLPKGTIVELRYTYDNSSSNPQNPVLPPQRVKYGVQSSDEMAELWLQMLPRTAADAKALTSEYNLQIARESIILNEMLLRQDPQDAASFVELGKARMALGDVTNAIPCFEKAVSIKPSPEAHYHLGLALEMVHAEYPARQQYEAALALDPSRYMARNNLGLLFLRHSEFAIAERHFREVLKEHPDNSMARNNLELTLKLAAKGTK
jgi:hypothetical protein